MPQFDYVAYPSRYNSLRLLGYDYASTRKLCAITLVTDVRRPLFADMPLAKAILTCLLSPQTLTKLQLRAFTLMPDHLHLLAGISSPDLDIPNVIGGFKSFTTQLYWKRSQEIFASGEISLPSQNVSKADVRESRALVPALLNGQLTLRPEVVELKNWPSVRSESFVKKHLWQARFFDHIIRNDNDLRENLEYIAMNPVRAGYVSQSCFYPYTGFLD
jgi:REP element-mobilizing transposase RayT